LKRPRRTIQGMKSRRTWALVGGSSLLAGALTLVPYLLAQRLAQPVVFNGFLINPLDGFSYLAKMRQGAAGAWTFTLPYAPDPGPGVVLYVYYNFLGHIASWFNLPLITVFHAVRALNAAGMFVLAYAFSRRILNDERMAWHAYLLTLVGSGLGWLAVAVGFETSDLVIPESIPFLTAYTNAHFPLIAGAILGVMLTVLGKGKLALRTLVAVLCGGCIAAVLPFSILTPAVALALWIGWEIVQSRSKALRDIWREQRTRLIPFFGFLLGAAPWLLYDLWVVRVHPVIAAWTAQNRTPSPGPLSYILGYGLILVMAIVGVVRGKPHRTPAGRLLLAWAVSNALLLYAPISLQRRLSLGLFFPIAALAALGLAHIERAPARARTIAIALLVLSIPSNLVVIGAGLAGVAGGEPMVTYAAGELGAYEWLAENAEPGALVLSALETGNRIPAHADVSVVYGHPFETPDAQAQEDLVEALYTWQAEDEGALRSLSQTGVAYVIYGPFERKLGEPAWLRGLTVVYDAGEVEIYEASGPK
jgi:hypothetical protein